MKELYIVSDLHMGGDGQLQVCDYTAEMVAFLQELQAKAAEGDQIELILAGDTFGFWELTSINGNGRLDEIIAHHRPIFDELKEAGRKIKITMMVGNHDYDLACDPVYVNKLSDWNIYLNTSLALTRDVDGHVIWIEHGQQLDVYNASADYRNPFALPLGYFITEWVVSGASLHSEFGYGNWLKDIRSIGSMQIPEWMFSNYFYREMNLFFRWLALPFLLLFSLTIFGIIGQALVFTNLVSANYFLNNPLIEWLGYVGDVFAWIITINMGIVLFLIILAIPLILLFRDVRSALYRFRILSSNQEREVQDLYSNDPYFEHGRKILDENEAVSAYVYGHTHQALLEKQADGRLIINTGTWLKILRRVSVRVGWLPAVYVPTFRLNYFKFSGRDGNLHVDYVEVAKEPEDELTTLQSVLTFWRQIPEGKYIPLRTVVPKKQLEQEQKKSRPII
ncbi:MAG: UDP-2,3-diacylglucosamine pyrophosphatase LpxH [Cellvibrionaceae bacterium]|jgi:UDP-2,3-diacylglucosamine pyrophosphatase LpxH